MKTTLRPCWARGWWGSGLMFAAMLLTLAISLCLFDVDGDWDNAHTMSLDLCIGMLATSLTVGLLTRLERVGWTLAVGPVPVRVIALHVPVPPPKSVSF